MPRPAFIVDGQMERRILEALCPNTPIKLIGCNGESVSMEVVAKFVDTQIRMLNNRNYPIVVLLDREGREESTGDLIARLKNELNAFGHEGQFAIGMPDRMIENWILADKKNFQQHCDRRHDYVSEGIHGKTNLRRMLARGATYHETTIGVSIFLSGDPKKIYENSESFRNFVDAIKGMDCPYLEPVFG